MKTGSRFCFFSKISFLMQSNYEIYHSPRKNQEYSFQYYQLKIGIKRNRQLYYVLNCTITYTYGLNPGIGYLPGNPPFPYSPV